MLDSGPDPVQFNPVLSPRSRVEPPTSEDAAGGDGSLWSRNAVNSIVSMGSAGSILSIGSAGSVLSIGSAGSILSIGSAGSILSIGSAGSVLSIGSIGSVASVGSGFSVGALGGWRERRGRVAKIGAGVLAVAAVLAALRR